MATREFPALGFDPAPGDTAAVGAAASDVRAAGAVFSGAAASVARLNSSAWTGAAADAFRSQLDDLPRDLDLAAGSHRTAAQALVDYGTGLVARQRRAGDLESRAADLRRRESAAVAEVNRLAGQTAPAGSAELARFKDRYDTARSHATSLGSDLQDVIAQARRLLDEHRSAASSAAHAINKVANAPYREPGWLSRAWSSVTSWIGAHADVLGEISTVLKGVSAVLGVLSLVPGLQFLAPFAIAAGAIALGLDMAVKLATGKGSWTSIGIDAALTFLPGGKILSGLKGVKAAVAGERGLAAGERAFGAGEKLLAEGEDLAGVAGAAVKGNPTTGLGSTAVHLGNGSNTVVQRLFPELSGTNPFFRLTKVTDGAHPNVAGWGFKNNCQSCVQAVDKQLSGLAKDAQAVERVPGDAMSSRLWKQHIASGVGTSNTFRSIGSYDDIIAELHNAGDGARGIIHGMRTGPGGVSVAGHVFNVVNRNGRVFFLDGQTGKLAYLENYSGGLEFLRTN
jgi:Papain fold toxin 1, glutamine deamidase